MNKKRGMIVIIMIVLILITGCTRRTTSPDQTVSQNVYKGTQGLEMKFSQNLPPRKLYDTGTLSLIAELENKGTYDLSGGRCWLHLSGYEETIIRGIQRQRPCGQNLWEKRSGFPEGGYDVAEFTTDLIRLPQGIDSLPQKFILTACYEYETTANPIVCIDPGIYKIRSIKEACVVRDVTVGGGQGAPVAVDRVEVQMVGSNKAAFTIHVSNVGKGRTLRAGTGLTGGLSHSCPFGLQFEDYDIVDYDVSMSGGFMLKCSPEKLRLVNNKGKIFCTFNVPGEYARTTPLTVRLRYNYMQNIFKDVEFIRTPE